MATDVAVFGTFQQNLFQRNVAEAEEPRGRRKLKLQRCCLTDSDVGCHNEAHESLRVFASFFALLSVNACHFSCTIKKKLFEGKQKTVFALCCVCLWNCCICLNSRQKIRLPSNSTPVCGSVLFKPAVDTQLIHEWGVRLHCAL